MSKSKPYTLGSLLEAYFHQRLVAQRKSSPRTVAAYRDSLRLLLTFVAEQKGRPPARLSLADLDRDTVLAFLDSLESARKNSVRTRNARRAAIRSFMNYVALCDPASLGVVQRVLAIPSKRHERKVVSYLRREQLDAILAVPDRATHPGRRDYALLLFLARTGARVSEATALNRADLRLDKPGHVLLRGKGNKQRAVPLAEDVRQTLTEWLQARGLNANEERPIFVNARGKRLSRFGVNYILERATAAATSRCADLERQCVSPHVLRHTLAMQLLQSGVDLTTIQSWLGHAGVETTHHYMEADLEMKHQALGMCQFPEGAVERFEPDDELLAMLARL